MDEQVNNALYPLDYYYNIFYFIKISYLLQAGEQFFFKLFKKLISNRMIITAYAVSKSKFR